MGQLPQIQVETVKELSVSVPTWQNDSDSAGATNYYTALELTTDHQRRSKLQLAAHLTCWKCASSASLPLFKPNSPTAAVSMQQTFKLQNLASEVVIVIICDGQGSLQKLEDQEPEERGEVNCSEKRWHQVPPQIQVRICHLQDVNDSSCICWLPAIPDKSISMRLSSTWTSVQTCNDAAPSFILSAQQLHLHTGLQPAIYDRLQSVEPQPHMI